MILIFRETDGKTGDRLTIGEKPIADGSTLVRSGRYIVGSTGGAPHPPVTVVDGVAIDLTIVPATQVLTADLLYDPNYFAIDGLNRLTAAGTLLTHDLLSVTHHGDTIPAAVVRGDIITGQGAAPNTFWQRLAKGTDGQYLKSNATDVLWADLPGSFSGFANPSASIGLTVVNGIATTAMRSDGAPALDQGIAPTWTSDHIWGTTKKVIFRDSALYISSKNDGYLDFDADTAFRFNTGNVGIGCTPGYKLDVQGGVLRLVNSNPDTYANRTTHIQFNSSAFLTSYSNKISNSMSSTAADTTMNFELTNTLGSGHTTIMTLLGSSRVGIGTATPQGVLDLWKNSPDSVMLSIRADFAGAGRYAMIRFGDQSQLTDYQKGAIIYEGVDAAARGKLHFALDDVNGADSVTLADAKMTILYTGYLGVGTTTPVSLTEIQGGLTTVGAVLTLGTKETTVVVNDVLGRINFYAPLEADGSDAILVGASIVAIAEDTFTATVNKTSLLFQTGASEVATTKMCLTSTGYLGINTVTPGAALDVRSAISHFGINGADLYLYGSALNFENNVNGNSEGFINYYGYNHGITQFRDLNICDGKSNTIAFFDGSTGNLGLGTVEPLLNVGTGSGGFSGLGLHIKAPAATQAFLVLEGFSSYSEGGHGANGLIFCNGTMAGGDDKLFQIGQDNRSSNTADLVFASLNDSPSTALKTALRLAHSTGYAYMIAGYYSSHVSVSSSTAEITINNNADSSASGILSLQNDRANPADNDEVGRIEMYGDDDGHNIHAFCEIVGRALDVTNGTEDGELTFSVFSNGDFNKVYMKIDGNTPRFVFHDGYMVFETIRSGATQVASGAAANEVWKTSGHATLPDNTLMIGV